MSDEKPIIRSERSALDSLKDGSADDARSWTRQNDEQDAQRTRDEESRNQNASSEIKLSTGCAFVLALVLLIATLFAATIRPIKYAFASVAMQGSPEQHIRDQHE